MKNKIFNKITLLLAVLILINMSFISAFSVSSPYMENKELNILLDSKTTDLQFILQNGGGATEPVNVRVAILAGSEIISLIDEDEFYFVSPGDQIPVNLRITLPDSVKAGDAYSIILSFTTITQGQSGEFGFGTGQEHRFNVVVTEEEEEVLEKEGNVKEIIIFLVIGILLILIIIANVLIKKKKKRK